jgi:hypothetical protein
VRAHTEQSTSTQGKVSEITYFGDSSYPPPARWRQLQASPARWRQLAKHQCQMAPTCNTHPPDGANLQHTPVSWRQLAKHQCQMAPTCETPVSDGANLRTPTRQMAPTCETPASDGANLRTTGVSWRQLAIRVGGVRCRGCRAAKSSATPRPAPVLPHLRARHGLRRSRPAAAPSPHRRYCALSARRRDAAPR